MLNLSSHSADTKSFTVKPDASLHDDGAVPAAQTDDGDIIHSSAMTGLETAKADDFAAFMLAATSLPDEEPSPEEVDVFTGDAVHLGSLDNIRTEPQTADTQPALLPAPQDLDFDALTQQSSLNNIKPSEHSDTPLLQADISAQIETVKIKQAPHDDGAAYQNAPINASSPDDLAQYDSAAHFVPASGSPRQEKAAATITHPVQPSNITPLASDGIAASKTNTGLAEAIKTAESHKITPVSRVVPAPALDTQTQNQTLHATGDVLPDDSLVIIQPPNKDGGPLQLLPLQLALETPARAALDTRAQPNLDLAHTDMKQAAERGAALDAQTLDDALDKISLKAADVDKIDTKSLETPPLTNTMSARMDPAPSFAIAAPMAPSAPAITTPAAAMTAPLQTPLDKPSVAALAQTVVKTLETQKGVSVRLDPPEMGRVYIDYQFDRDNSITAMLRADTPDILAQLRDNSTALQDFLKQSGFENVTLSFEQNSDAQTSQDGGYQDKTLTRESEQNGYADAAPQQTAIAAIHRALGQDALSIDIKL